MLHLGRLGGRQGHRSDEIAPLAAQQPIAAEAVLDRHPAARITAPADLGAKLRELRAAPRLVAVEEEVHRSEPLDGGIVPGAHQRRHLLARLDERSGGLDRARPKPARIFERRERRTEGVTPGRVGAVAEGDQTDAVFRQPTHLRTETRQPAAVRHHMREIAGLRDAQPITVAGCVQLHGAGGVARHHRGPRAPHLLHLAKRRAGYGTGLGGVARRPGAQQETDVAPEVLERGEHAAHRAEGAVRQLRLALPARILPAVALSEPRRRHRTRLERGRGHAERSQDLALHISRVGHTGDVRDHTPEDGVRVVRVLVGDAGRVGERDARTHQRGELLLRDAELLIAPRVVLGEPRRHGQEMPQRDGRRIGRQRSQAAQFGDIPLDGIIERELALVTQLQDRHRRERFGHAGDAEHRVTPHRLAALDIAQPDGADVGELAVDDDAPGGAGDVLARDELAHHPVHLGIGRGQLRTTVGILEGDRRRGVGCDTEESEGQRQHLAVHRLTVTHDGTPPKRRLG